MTMPRRAIALAAAALLIASACSTSGGGTSLVKLKFQLQWVAQAQFAGYYAALDQGYYKDAGLDVSLLLGGPQVDNVQVVASGQADIGTAWLPKMLQSRENGTDLVSIAQVFQRSGTRMVSFKDKNITGVKDLDGKKIGSWLGGNEPELFAALTKAGLDPAKENVIKQNFDMSGLLQGDLDIAQAMIYNEYPQVLEAKNPGTGRALPADRRQPARLQRSVRRHGHAPGPDLRQRQVAGARARTRTRRRSSSRPPTRAGSTAATTPRSASTSCSRTGPSSVPATRPGR